MGHGPERQESMMRLSTNMTRRQAVALALAALPAIGCAKQETADEADGDSTSEASPESNETQVEALVVGEKASTDIVELTLERAELATALHNGISTEALSGQVPADEVDLGLPKEYDATEDANNPYVAPIGHVLVAYTVSVANLDRTSHNLDEWSGHDFVTLTYSGKDYSADEKKTVLEISGDGSLNSSPTSNLLLMAQEASTYRRYAEFAVEPESLADPFQLAFSLPNCQGDKEQFTYQIG